LMIRLSHRRMQIAVSMVAGVMLGVGLLHMLPHALIEAPDAVYTVLVWVLAGFLAMFFIERFFCYHHHEVPSDEDLRHDQSHEACHVEKDVGEGGIGAGCHGSTHQMTWSGAAVGLTLHSVLAGVALAASVSFAARDGSHESTLAGFGAFLVIFLHKPFDSLTICTLMSIGGWSTLARHAVNGLFALMVPLGVGLFLLGIGHTHADNNVLAYALAFSAGTFLCVSMSDLLPELQFHSHDRTALSAALIVGLSIAWAAGLLESCGHQHGSHQGESHQQSCPHSHDHSHNHQH